jgi:hypothetical protein
MFGLCTAILELNWGGKMTEKINEPIAVSAIFNRDSRGVVKVIPQAISWRDKRYAIQQMGLYHPEKRGNKRLHIFSFSSGPIAFRTELDPETLEWTLAEIFYES